MNISCSGINFSLPERGRATQQLCSPPRLRVVYAPVPTWAAAAAVAAAAAAAATGAHTPSRSSHAPCSPQLLFQTPPPFPGPHCLFIHSAGCALSHPHLEIPPSLSPPPPIKYPISSMESYEESFSASTLIFRSNKTNT